MQFINSISFLQRTNDLTVRTFAGVPAEQLALYGRELQLCDQRRRRHELAAQVGQQRAELRRQFMRTEEDYVITMARGTNNDAGDDDDDDGTNDGNSKRPRSNDDDGSNKKHCTY